MNSQTLRNGASIDTAVRTGDRVLVSPYFGTFSARIVSGLAGLPVTLAVNSAAITTYGPWTNDVVIHIRAGATSTVDYDIDQAPAIEYGIDRAARISSAGALVDGSGALVSGGGSSGVTSATVAVAASRVLTASDNGQVLECTAAGLTLTVPAGLPAGFGCAVIPNGTTSLATSGGALLDGAATTQARAASGNKIVAIVARVSATNSYVLTGT